MAKKLYSTERWKDHIARAQARELANTRRRKRAARLKRKKRSVGPKRYTATLTAPHNFSLLQSPENTIRFLNEFERAAGKSNINLNLTGITSISIDAITALTALVRRLRYTHISGNIPSDPACQSILVQSGFFEQVRPQVKLPSADRGRMKRQESKKVEGKLAKQLIHHVTSALSGHDKPCRAAYRALIESMANTNEHAARTSLEVETWWATAYADAERGCACFTFLDTGVGIFKSVKLGKIRRAYQVVGKLIGLRNDSDILREILEGKVESSTGLSYRGKGLPALYNALQAGRLGSLVIVSNQVFANVKQNDFRILNEEFRGTLLYWEVCGGF